MKPVRVTVKRGENMLIENSVQEYLDHIVECKEVAGINILIQKSGEDLFYAESGYSDIVSEKPISRDTIFRMYSMTKPITAAAVMMLVEKGLIGLGEPVKKYIPGFKDQMIYSNGKAVPVSRPAYIKDLMSMTSGLPYPNREGCAAEKRVQEVFDLIDEGLYTDGELSTLEIANRLGEAGVMFQPGSAWAYGTSADILGAIVEIAGGMPFGEFLAENIFKPLEMDDTGFCVSDDKLNRLASVYERRNGELELFKTRNLGIRYEAKGQPAFESGGAGLMSTLDDYSHFARMLMDHGEYKGIRLIEKKTVEYMASSILPPHLQESLTRSWDSLCGYSYGCLMRKSISPQMAYHMTFQGEYGWDGWLGTFFENLPTHGITMLMGMQLSDPEGNFISEKIRNLIHPML